jgi:hypothetical protein
MTAANRIMLIIHFMNDWMRPCLSRFLACLLGTVACVSVALAGSGESSNPEKLAQYEQLKLPELVRRANANDAWAQFELGSRFNYGRNAPKNNTEALNWLRRAAQNGQPDAQRLLAVKLYNGYDVTVDHDEALLWSQRLAESGDASGQLMLGNMYANGEGGPRDLVRAYMWYDIAATMAQQATGDPDLQETAVDLRDRTGALLLPVEEVRAQQLASDWWLRKQGISLAAQPKPKATTKKKVSPKAVARPKTPQKPLVPTKPAIKKP